MYRLSIENPLEIYLVIFLEQGREPIPLHVCLPRRLSIYAYKCLSAFCIYLYIFCLSICLFIYIFIYRSLINLRYLFSIPSKFLSYFLLSFKIRIFIYFSTLNSDTKGRKHIGNNQYNMFKGIF